MTPKMARVLVIDPADGDRGALALAMTALIDSTEVAHGFDPDTVAWFDLVAVAFDALSNGERKALVKHFARRDGRPGLIVVTELSERRELAELFASHAVANVIASHKGQLDARDLAATAEKLLGGELFGLERYVDCGPSTLRLGLRATGDVPGAVSAIERYASDAGLHGRLVEHCCTAADEFMTNALYNAPVDRDGKPRYAHLPRTEPVTLEPGQWIELAVSYDGKRLGVSTADPFGTLGEARLLDYLAKCMRGGEGQIDQKDGGAGLGLYFAFDALSHFVVNLAPGKRTEMIGILDAHSKYREFAARAKSFNVFSRRAQ